MYLRRYVLNLKRYVNFKHNKQVRDVIKIRFDLFVIDNCSIKINIFET